MCWEDVAYHYIVDGNKLLLCVFAVIFLTAKGAKERKNFILAQKHFPVVLNGELTVSNPAT